MTKIQELEKRIEELEAISEKHYNRLTKKEVIRRIRRISEMPGESDLQHCIESGLYHEFVECIVEDKYKTKEEIEGVAKELIKVNKLEYRRWFT